MKQNKKIFMIAAVIFMLAIFISVALEKGNDIFEGLSLYILILIVIFAIITLIIASKKDKELKEGQPADDELSQKIKYKAGYYAYLGSMYVWFVIFIFKNYFPNIESMLGGGILVSAAISFISKFIVKRNFNDKQN